MRFEDRELAKSWLDKAHDDERTIEILLAHEAPPGPSWRFMPSKWPRKP